jgi:small conductance mechanosensitive channel
MRRFRKHNLPQVAPRARTLTLQTAQRARRAKWELLLVAPLFALTLVAYFLREQIFGLDTPIRVAAAILMVVLGWRLARDFGRFIAPTLFRRMDPATAGTVGFLIRLAFLVVATVIALRVAGIKPQALALGGAITAVIFGLAAQQTLGNLIAGLVLISARPFKVGDRVRLQAGNLAGQLEGVVASLGLLYTTFAQGQDAIMVPNSTVLSSAVVPLREPASVDLRARLRPDVKPSAVQALLEGAITTPVRGEPSISLEEVDSDEVVVRIQATPLSDADGPRLADEVLAAVVAVTDSHVPEALTQAPAEPPPGLETRDDGSSGARARPARGARAQDPGAIAADGEAPRRGAAVDAAAAAAGPVAAAEAPGRRDRYGDPSTQEYES